jgi:hypothetical protein
MFTGIGWINEIGWTRPFIFQLRLNNILKGERSIDILMS